MSAGHPWKSQDSTVPGNTPETQGQADQSPHDPMEKLKRMQNIEMAHPTPPAKPQPGPVTTGQVLDTGSPELGHLPPQNPSLGAQHSQSPEPAVK